MSSSWIPFVNVFFARTIYIITDNLTGHFYFSCNFWIYESKLTADKLNYFIIASNHNVTKLTVQQRYKILTHFHTEFRYLLFVAMQRHRWKSEYSLWNLMHCRRWVETLVVIVPLAFLFQRRSEESALLTGQKHAALKGWRECGPISKAGFEPPNFSVCHSLYRLTHQASNFYVRCKACMARLCPLLLLLLLFPKRQGIWNSKFFSPTNAPFIKHIKYTNNEDTSTSSTTNFNCN
jgi:hypothetical protein